MRMDEPILLIHFGTQVDGQMMEQWLFLRCSKEKDVNKPAWAAGSHMHQRSAGVSSRRDEELTELLQFP